MRVGIKIILLTVAAALFALPVAAGDASPDKVRYVKLDPGVASASDEQLLTRQTDFEKFAREKIREMNANHILSRSRMQISRNPDGLYHALFHEIDGSSLNFQVLHSTHRKNPYVAVLSYREKVYSASCSSPDDCRLASFSAIEEIPNRHIFTYSNGAWQ